MIIFILYIIVNKH